MTDLETRLKSALDSLPEAGATVRERAVRSAIGAAPAAPPARRRAGRRVALALCAAAVTIGTGVALAGSGVIEVRVGGSGGAPAPSAPPPRPLSLPPGAHGIAVVAGGRLFLRTRSGLGIEGLRVTSAELSPNALYVAVGLGRSLAALSPGGRRAWVRRTAGPVVAASWSPYPVWIAYIVRSGGRNALHVIEGDGDHDRVVADRVVRLQPQWSSDGTRLHFVVGTRWMTYAPSTGEPPVRAGGCPACVPLPGSARALLQTTRPGWSVAARSDGPTAPGLSALAIVHADAGRRRVEAWWTPPAALGAPRLLMRRTVPAGPVQISVR